MSEDDTPTNIASSRTLTPGSVRVDHRISRASPHGTTIRRSRRAEAAQKTQRRLPLQNIFDHVNLTSSLAKPEQGGGGVVWPAPAGRALASLLATDTRCSTGETDSDAAKEMRWPLPARESRVERKAVTANPPRPGTGWGSAPSASGWLRHWPPARAWRRQTRRTRRPRRVTPVVAAPTPAVTPMGVTPPVRRASPPE